MIPESGYSTRSLAILYGVRLVCRIGRGVIGAIR